MLYCPRCRRAYEDGTRRFCDNDGGRLLPAPAADTEQPPTGGVFTTLLGKAPKTSGADQKMRPAPRFVPLNKTEESAHKLTSFPTAGRIFQTERFLKPPTGSASEAEVSILEHDPLPQNVATVLEFEPIRAREPDAPPAGPGTESTKPAPRLIKPSEIASGTAEVGNRQKHPFGRQALSWDDPGALVGQTVKGRYLIVGELDADDEESLIYLGEDKIVAGKRVTVRVFMNDFAGADAAEEKIFAEERVSLSHLNHPNIASVFDSGELQEGNQFIVSEFVEGESLADILRQSGQFDPPRAARIIREASYALSEAHRNGILHRSLKPENICLVVSEAGLEQVKLLNFGVSHGELTDSNLAYKAPEEIENGASTYASDIYALAVIGYQLMTARVPFPVETERALVKAQRQGLSLPPSSLRHDLEPLADRILEKALAFSASDRYPKARDFGDAFFNALTGAAPSANAEAVVPVSSFPAPENRTKREFFGVPAIGKTVDQNDEPIVEGDIHISPSGLRPTAEADDLKASDAWAWEKRPTGPRGWSAGRLLAAIGGLLLLSLAIWGVSRLAANRSTPPGNAGKSARVPETFEPAQR